MIGTTGDESDVIERDSHFRPWMRPFLPDDPYRRDFALMMLGILVSGLLAVATVSYINEIVGIVILCIGGAHFSWRYWVRIIRRAEIKKRKSGKKETHSEIEF